MEYVNTELTKSSIHNLFQEKIIMTEHISILQNDFCHSMNRNVRPKCFHFGAARLMHALMQESKKPGPLLNLANFLKNKSFIVVRSLCLFS